MRAYWVHVEHDFAKPPERIFAHLAEHENLADVFGVKVRVSDPQGIFKSGMAAEVAIPLQ